jgi:hypothetical protein
VRYPDYNLFRDGYEECAEYVKKVILRTKSTNRLFVCPKGGVRVHLLTSKEKPRDESELVGIYNRHIGIEVIEGDLIEHLKQQSARAAA